MQHLVSLHASGTGVGQHSLLLLRAPRAASSFGFICRDSSSAELIRSAFK
jgi:hypothetical protein